MAQSIRVVACRPLTYAGADVSKGRLLAVTPVEASILIRSRAVRFATGDDREPVPPPPPSRRRYRRRDLDAQT